MKTAFITGVSSGIGKVTARGLAAREFHVVAAGRSRDRARPVIDTILDDGGSAEFLELDLASLSSVRTAAAEFEKRNLSIDALVNNAGVWRVRGLTVDGFESHFGINHLGPFLLTNLLRETFSPGARIVTVASAVHQRASGIDFEAVTRPTKTRLGLDEYAVSKLANILFSSELARRQPDCRTYAVHPGFTDTAIIPFWARPFLRSRLISPEAGAETSIWCATEPALQVETGGYYVRCARSAPSGPARDTDLASELWERSGLWCGTSPDLLR